MKSGGLQRWRQRRRTIVVIAIAVVLAMVTARSCGVQQQLPGDAASERPLVVASFSLVADWAAAVAGEYAEVRSLTPIGAEVHEWELRPRDFVNVEHADVFFYNGLMLEQWMHQVEAVVGEGVPLVALAEQSGFETRPIVTGEYAGDPDPHLWMDPRAVMAFVTVIADTLAEIDPAHAEGYRHNAEQYRGELQALHEELEDILAVLPDHRRTLISSEAAFIYFAAAYGFFHDGIWGTNAEVEGSPRQIMRITDLIAERQPPAVFWESTISDRYVRGVARDTGVAVAGPLYVDSLGGTNSGAETYLEMMRHNARLLVRALGESP